MRTVTAEQFTRAWEATCEEEPEARQYGLVVMHMLALHSEEIRLALEVGHSLRATMGTLYQKARTEVAAGRAMI